jgi:uncharacterized protein YegP (UPF0339 family)
MRKYTVEYYKDEANEWRWRVIASNGRIVADGGEGYKTKFFCAKDIKRLIEELPIANITYKDSNEKD